MSQHRPAFQTMWYNFATIHGDGTVASVGKKIGGKVQQNIEIGLTNPKLGFENACAIRMSYSLNYSGIHIEHTKWRTVSGADKKWYIYRVDVLRDFLQHTFGKADKSVKNPKPSDFAGLKGILVFSIHSWLDASGHATLWDGRTCSDHCYFPLATEASLWLLK